MPFTEAEPLSIAAFLAIVAAVIAAAVFAVRFAVPELARRFAIGLFLWLGLAALAVGTGVVAAHPMPGLPIFLLVMNLGAVALALSPVGGRLAAGLPLAALIAFQAFRLPLELVLHWWSEQGTIPGTMTWTGQNWDVASGILALALAPLAGRSRAAAWFFDVAGFALLLNVLRVAILSSPLPYAWKVDPPLQIALRIPYFLIVPVCVGGALAGHLILTRKLLGAYRPLSGDRALVSRPGKGLK